MGSAINHDPETLSSSSGGSTLTKWGLSVDAFRRGTEADVTRNLSKALKSRHMHMIAIAGAIGAGLFVASGEALAVGGPAGLVIAFLLSGLMIYCVVYALGELAIMFPVSGGFYTYSTRFISRSWGFAMGWNYVLQWATILPLELTVASLVVEWWEWNVPRAVWVTIFWTLLVIVNVFGAIGYGETEFWAAAVKLFTILVFILLGVILICGGGPSNGLYGSYTGAKTWYDPGAFANGFKGVCSVFVIAAFAFSGTEIVGLAAAEARNPRKSIPRAVKQVFWRVVVFYVLALLIAGLLIPYDDPRLIGKKSFASGDSAASPFVIALENAKILGLPHLVNVTILVAVMSIGNSAIYAGSRTLTAIAEHGYAPEIFSYVDRAGRPIPSTLFLIAFGSLAYVGTAGDGYSVFKWLLSLGALSSLFTWGSICVAHIRFRKAWKAQLHTLDEIPFRPTFGIAGSWIGLGLIIMILVAQFYIALFPIGKKSNAADFFKAYLGLPVILAFWAAGYYWKREGFIRIQDINVDDGRHVWDTEEMIQREREVQSQRSTGQKIFDFFC